MALGAGLSVVMPGRVPGIHVSSFRDKGVQGRDHPAMTRKSYFTSWMRLIMSAYFGPYLSHTGLTASWKAFLSASETSMI